MAGIDRCLQAHRSIAVNGGAGRQRHQQQEVNANSARCGNVECWNYQVDLLGILKRLQAQMCWAHGRCIPLTGPCPTYYHFQRS
ncbi:hypothetical protein, partial [Mesorhizobium sp. M8A.F.Ca.ET.218.01.1.1]|uniref:hypothetical protein n=1 Tax=Mesorhizobium sp. M8A.F.Ca.ET.218.01.1.1 TaxID=2563971 RepID=UPI001AED1992